MLQSSPSCYIFFFELILKITSQAIQQQIPKITTVYMKYLLQSASIYWLQICYFALDSESVLDPYFISQKVFAKLQD